MPENEFVIDEAVWLEYTRTKDKELRNKIVMAYVGTVRCIALQMRGMYKSFADIDDIVNQGIITLTEVIDKFEYDRGLKFETYASIRIKGAVIDYIRKQDWVPRRVRKSAKDIDDTYNRLYTEYNRKPTPEELCGALGITEEELSRAYGETYGFNLLSYEELISGVEGDSSGLDIAASPFGLPGEAMQNEELRGMLVSAIDSLSEREKMVVSLYYFEELKLKEIANVMSITESRACQLHSQALFKLRKNMEGYVLD